MESLAAFPWNEWPGSVEYATSEECQTNQQINSVVCNENTSYIFAYFSLSNLGRTIKEWGMKGSVGANMNKTEFTALRILEAPEDIQLSFQELVEPIFDYILITQKQLQVVIELEQLVNARMVLAH